MTSTSPNSTRARQLRVLFLIPRQSDGPDEERDGVQAAADLRDDIRAGRVCGGDVVLVGPVRDTKPTTWTAKARQYSGLADLVIVEGHGCSRTGQDSCLRAGWHEYVIGTSTTHWRPFLDARHGPRPQYPHVVLGSCWALRHVARIGQFFAPGQHLIASSRITRTDHVDSFYRPLLSALLDGRPERLRAVMADSPAGWASVHTPSAD